LIVWDDLAAGSPSLWDGHSQTVTCVTYNHTGDLLATGSEDRTIWIRNADTRQAIRRDPLKANGRINRLAFSPDGKYLAAATSEILGPEDAPDGLKFAAKLWAVESGEWVRDFGGHKGVVTDLAFSPDGARMVTSSQDGRLRVWDMRNLSAKMPWKELSHDHDKTFGGDEPFWMAQNAFSAVAFDEDGHLASATSNQSFAEVWDIASGKPIDILLGHQGGIRALVYSSGGGKHKIATAGGDQTIRLYYLETRDLIARAKLLLGANPGAQVSRRR
jgi:WD40 repeat protein